MVFVDLIGYGYRCVWFACGCTWFSLLLFVAIVGFVILVLVAVFAFPCLCCLLWCGDSSLLFRCVALDDWFWCGVRLWLLVGAGCFWLELLALVLGCFAS